MGSWIIIYEEHVVCTYLRFLKRILRFKLVIDNVNFYLLGTNSS